ncbi:DNA recombination protein RmuC [candidate division WOR-3 bacterium]|nr:DNA recombination protein RmuC [candidate division WOR-3 bacterium]
MNWAPFLSLGLNAAMIILIGAALYYFSKKIFDKEKSFFGEMVKDNQSTEKRLLDELSRSRIESDNKLENMRNSINESLRNVQEDSMKNLEKIRATVEDKLQGTLEKKLTESFGIVSERLEQVYKGLGEMQSVAAGVGDLKKVLSNVKTRGVLGEFQLESILEQVMAPDQYIKNFKPRDGRGEVEFAILLPGKDKDEKGKIFLPVDSKFPVENYLKMVEAQENANKNEIDKYSKALENDIKNQAAKINEKYIYPPVTTDFALMFLPSESLFAEVVRRPGLIEKLQNDSRIVVSGPTTLWAILTSLQMGFRTLAIQKRSSEVWKILGAVKTEWAKYGEQLAKIHKKLDEASGAVSEAEKNLRKVEKNLRDVEVLPEEEARKLLE